MWCLETIVALNQAAAERARRGESELLAYADVGINVSPETRRRQKEEEEERKAKKPEFKVA